ncbi:hypothetical protein NL676_028269 [Syzygium grande]|nr:hypothetical protein NL676_028269 [Syzygium grande]
MAMERDALAESLNDLFLNLSTMVRSELQGANNHLELLEKMNLRVGEEYKEFGDVASGLRVFVEQLKSKSGSSLTRVRAADRGDRGSGGALRVRGLHARQVRVPVGIQVNSCLPVL